MIKLKTILLFSISFTCILSTETKNNEEQEYVMGFGDIVDSFYKINSKNPLYVMDEN